MFRASCNCLKLLVPISSQVQLFEATCTDLSSWFQVFEATYNYFEPLAMNWRYLQLFRATCIYLKVHAPISSHLQFFVATHYLFQAGLNYFETFCTYFEPRAVIWRYLCLFWATLIYLKLPVPLVSHLQFFKKSAPISCHLQLFAVTCAYFEPLAISWSYLHLFQAGCDYLKLPAPISSLLQFF